MGTFGGGKLQGAPLLLCVDRGVTGCVVMASGFGEVDAEDRRSEEDMRAISTRTECASSGRTAKAWRISELA